MKDCPECEDHGSKFGGRKHPDANRKRDLPMVEPKRGAGHPAHHTKGKMPSQLAPNHGPLGLK